MLESKIINDINGTYLIISSDENVVPAFEMKMFEYNEIKGFLPITISRVNNNVQFHYKVMDYENLTKAFYNKAFNIDDIKDIFQSITTIGQRVAEFLLNPDSIMLSPEYIYVRNKEFLFCYLPTTGLSFHKGVRELMEYILERLDHSNQENVLLAYGLYQKILKNNFTMEMLMEEFFKNSDLQVNRNVVQANFGTVETAFIEKESNEEKLSKSDTSSSIADIDELEAELIDMERETRKKSKKSKEKFNIQQLFGKKKKVMFQNSKHDYSKKQNKTLMLAEKTPYGSTQLLTGKSLINQSGGRDIFLINFPLELGSGVAGEEGKIDNQAVSRRHAVITWECGMYYVEDLGSTNGTFVNGSRISSYEPIQIKEGDIVSFANERFCLN